MIYCPVEGAINKVECLFGLCVDIRPYTMTQLWIIVLHKKKMSSSILFLVNSSEYAGLIMIPLGVPNVST